ncbi:pilus assembly protein N-terminal domain-containing protein [Ahrensia marina]|uniref:pilus assembly protein N-terminal domain-containing protein n=1 Tax=Ahrensia marina TaxID=1514904 RepID=UPI000B2D2CBA|nr:pilus assembly protein N-terminal domain-containing protein [Ahrensia marina]
MISRVKLFCMTALIAGTHFVAAAHAADYVAETQPVAHSNAAAIKVELNNAKIVKLSRPATTVIVGNPEIADVTIQDAETLVLTGRGFGRTNLVILDESGTPILDERIAVSRDTSSILRVYRRAEIENLSCEPECEGAYLTEAELQAIAATSEANDSGDDD